MSFDDARSMSVSNATSRYVETV